MWTAGYRIQIEASHKTEVDGDKWSVTYFPQGATKQWRKSSQVKNGHETGPFMARVGLGWVGRSGPDLSLYCVGSGLVQLCGSACVKLS